MFHLKLGRLDPLEKGAWILHIVPRCFLFSVLWPFFWKVFIFGHFFGKLFGKLLPSVQSFEKREKGPEKNAALCFFKTPNRFTKKVFFNFVALIIPLQYLPLPLQRFKIHKVWKSLKVTFGRSNQFKNILITGKNWNVKSTVYAHFKLFEHFIPISFWASNTIVFISTAKNPIKIFPRIKAN